ncbi:MAG: 50S ribosomal protein L15 [Verrucomicrobiae bacterium]|nr:50S ribosomal protein L15 [Verrucomicrobiae bacterium]
MRLHDLKHRPGAKHRVKRLGSGESSGHGKTSGKGHKGQKARSGGSLRLGFEGGQMPLIRRIPKRGFNNNAFRYKVAVVNLESLNAFENGTVVDAALLEAKRLVTGTYDLIKVLGEGEVSKKLTLKVNRISAAARAKLEKAGGTVELISLSKPAAGAKA